MMEQLSERARRGVRRCCCRLAVPAIAQQAADTVAPEAATAVEPKPAVHAPSGRWSSPPIRSPPRPGSTCCAPAATRPTRWWRCRPCSAWSSRNPPASAAAPSSSGTTRKTGKRHHLRRPRDGAGRGDAGPVPRRDGKPLDFFDAVVGGRSVGVPGVPRLLETVHARYGKRPWAVAVRAGDRARRERLRRLAAAARVDRRRRRPARRASRRRAPISSTPPARRLPPGAMLRNPDYAETLRAIAADGADAFYKGPIAGEIVAAVQRPPDQSRPPQPGRPRRLPVKERPAVCAPYRGYRGLRHGTALLRRAADRPDPRHGRAVRHRHARPGRPGKLAHHRRRHPPRLRRPRALHRRQRFRVDAERPARPGLPQGALAR